MRWRRCTRRRWSGRGEGGGATRRGLIAAALAALPVAVPAAAVAAFAPAAHAQLLNLDRGRPPQPGEGKALAGMAEALERQVRGLERDLKRAEGETARASIAFRTAVRRLVIALAKEAESIGEPASVQALAALHLAASLKDLDELASKAGGTEEGEVHLRLAMERFAEEIGEAPAIPSDAAAVDDYLRDRFAMLVQLQVERTPRAPWCQDASRCGWLLEEGGGDEAGEAADLSALMQRLGQAPGVSEAVLQRLELFNELLLDAEAWWIYSGTAEALRNVFLEGGAVLEARPPWLPETVHTKLVQAYIAAAGDFTDKSRRRAAGEALRDQMRLAAVFEMTKALGARAEATPIRDAMVSLAESVAGRREGAPARVRNSEIVLALLSERDRLGDERSVARELRPGWRALSDDAERTEALLQDALPRLVASGRSMTDPALAGVVSAHRRSLDDLRALQTISQWLGTWLNVPPSPYTPAAPGGPGGGVDGQAARRLAAARVLELCQRLSRDQEKGAALAEIRAFAADLRDLAALPAEADLTGERAAVLDVLTGGRASELERHIRQVRDRWLMAWATAGSGRDTGEDAAALAAELRTLARLCGALEDGMALLELRAAAGAGEVARGMSARVGVLGVAGVGVSRLAAVRLSEDVRAELPGLTGSVLAGDGGAAARVERLARDRAVHALMARLHRAAAERETVYCPRWVAASPRPVGADVWLAEHEQDLAAISRYAQEYAHAVEEGETKFAGEVLAYLNVRAEELLSAMGKTPAAR